ncbi:endo-1,4-beta-xylanase [Amycolatopsis arida]|uniref:Beta-xylanase n=1 Tax=Amycolatopsis arida TaxID=587909 RepID=A0A1I5UKF1_9PSEU|nr:glycosyl hydrolase family 10 [Amycolatopsis arida]SFP95720.1 endo-1,4-beta-xylanase [Amycolatopsis arida]
MTPENEMKWESLERNRGQYHARRNGKSLRGHTLVWHSQHPSWLNNLSADELRTVVRNHITTVMSRYRGRIRAWDVVNEAFNEDGSRRNSIFQQKLGDG